MEPEPHIGIRELESDHESGETIIKDKIFNSLWPLAAAAFIGFFLGIIVTLMVFEV